MLALGRPVHQPTKLRRQPVESFATVDRFDGAPLGGRVKVRIGVGVGPVSARPEMARPGFAELIDDIDGLGFDSIWLPEILTAPALDPLVGLSFAAAHNPHLKLGTTMLGPGRNPVRLAKQLAGLDRLSGGRLLVTLVPGLARQPESGAVGAGLDKGRMMDVMLPLLRRLWAGESVSYRGETVSFENVTLEPLPVQQPLEVWTGGMVPAALRRCGRFGRRLAPVVVHPVGGGRGPRGHRPCRRRSRPGHQRRALRGVHRVCQCPPHHPSDRGAGRYP